MKREWNAPEVEELNISKTANGTALDNNYDSDWQQTPDGHWYRLGGTAISQG